MTTLNGIAETMARTLGELASARQSQLEAMSAQLGKLTESNEKKLEAVRGTVEARLQSLQGDNEAQLEQMRATVEEKLQGTLEKRLGESFKQVSERLEQVHKGLGEMQVLAAGVGDLKRVLTNVKTRGTWGEVQLGALLEQVLTAEQYARNVATRDRRRRPGRVRDPAAGARATTRPVVWLPIDAKFPLEDYQRLVEAAGAGRPRRRRCGGAAAGGAGPGLRAGHQREVPRPAGDDRLRHPVPADRGAVRRGGPAAGAGRGAPARVRVLIAGPTTLWRC